MTEPRNLITESRPFSRVDVARADETSAFGAAMGGLTLAIANADRALNGRPLLSSPLDIYPSELAERYHAAGLEAVLRQQAGLEREAVNDAADELVLLVERVLTAPAEHVINQPVALREYCRALVRSSLDNYRASLAAQLVTIGRRSV